MNNKPHTTRLIVAWLLASLACITQGQVAGRHIDYTLDVIPRQDRTDLRVTAHWRAEEAQPFSIELPADYYGTANLAGYVAEIQGLKGTTVGPGKDGRARLISPRADKQVWIRYRMSYDPEAMKDASFGPITTPKRFQTFLCQWMLRIGNLEEKRVHTITLGKLPAGWKPYSTLAPKTGKHKIEASYMGLISAMIGAGDVATHHFVVSGKPVDVYLDRSFTVPQAAILKKIEAVVRIQRAWFKDNSQPFYVVSLAIRPDNVAGTEIGNGFVCFVKEDATELQLLALLSHEMLHHWVPSKVHIQDPGETERWKWEWFDEGFDDYFSRRVLLESGAITTASFADMLNRDLRNIAENPIRNKTYDEVKADMAANQFSVAHKKLSYYRGAVMASNWNARIVARSGGKRSLSDVLRKLFVFAAKSGGRLTEDQFYTVLLEDGIDARAERKRHILDGETIVPEPLALGSDYELANQPFPNFEAGFDVRGSLAVHRIVGLVKGGPAEVAGIREGMPLRQVQNTNRFGNAWDANRPLSAWVEVEGKIKRVDYMPHGSSVFVPQYVKKG